MALTINLTLVVQIVHFLIAYAFISKLLLKPAYAAYKADQERLHQLRSTLIAAQEKLSLKEEHKRGRWLECQEYFQQNRPTFEERGQIVRQPIVFEMPSLSNEQRAQLAQEISEQLKEKVVL